MRVRKLDSNGDIVTSGVTWATEAEAVAQTVKTRLRLFLGEYFRDITVGVPWLSQSNGEAGILAKGFSQDQVESLLRLTIAQTDEVLQILEFESTYDINTRKVSIKATILTKYGEAKLSYGNTY